MKSHRRLSIVVVPFAAAILSPTFHFSAFATTPVYVYDSFGPGGSYSNLHWLIEGSSGSEGYQGHAESFVPAISGYLSEIQLATLPETGSPNSNFSIAEDNGSGLPGTILESFNNLQNPIGFMTINSVTTPLLQAGQTYWICDQPSAANTVTSWYWNSQGLTGNDAFATTGTGESWNNGGAAGTGDAVFAVTVVPIPEPSTASLILLGAGLWMARTRRFPAGLNK